jgi:hypothetical protein
METLANLRLTRLYGMLDSKLITAKAQWPNHICHIAPVNHKWKSHILHIGRSMGAKRRIWHRRNKKERSVREKRSYEQAREHPCSIGPVLRRNRKLLFAA